MSLKPTPTPGSFGLFYDRWKALDSLIAETRDSYAAHASFDRQDTILSLLKSLRAFGQGQFEFFYYGFDPGAFPPPAAPRYRLQIWDEFPPEDILTGILLQMGHDLELIQRAATQRIMSGAQARDTLKRADTLAWCAMQPAIEREIIERPTTVLTHFEKSAEFYNIPYASIALIAVPFTCTAQNTHQDFLAIPHEVGHYVYRHPTASVKDEFDNLRQNPQIAPEYKDWLKLVFEEMCADIYGCLVAGPVVAQDFQTVSQANSQQDFADGDGEHPNAALRPFIYTQVLADPLVDVLTSGAWHNIGRLLEEQWDLQLYRRHISEFGITARVQQGQGQLVTSRRFKISDLLNRGGRAAGAPAHRSLADVVPEVVTALLQELATYVARNPGAPAQKILGWAGMLAADVQPKKLLPLFEANFDSLSQDPNCQPPTAPEPPDDLWYAWVTKNNPRLASWSRDEPLPSGEVRDPEYMQPNSWGYILAADGWSFGGPTGDPGHPTGDPGHPTGDPGHPAG